MCCQNFTLGGIFSPVIWNSFTYFDTTHHDYSLPGVHNTDGIFKVMGSKVKVTETFSVGGIAIDCSLLKICSVGMLSFSVTSVPLL